MKYNVLNFITNTQNQYVASVVATYDNLKGAIVKYHQLLANLHNASDVARATVKIENEYGREVAGFLELIDNEVAAKSEKAETE
jgi:hypothetical protein